MLTQFRVRVSVVVFVGGGGRTKRRLTSHSTPTGSRAETTKLNSHVAETGIRTPGCRGEWLVSAVPIALSHRSSLLKIFLVWCKWRKEWMWYMNKYCLYFIYFSFCALYILYFVFYVNHEKGHLSGTNIVTWKLLWSYNIKTQKGMNVDVMKYNKYVVMDSNKNGKWLWPCRCASEKCTHIAMWAFQYVYSCIIIIISLIYVCAEIISRHMTPDKPNKRFIST